MGSVQESKDPRKLSFERYQSVDQSSIGIAAGSDILDGIIPLSTSVAGDLPQISSTLPAEDKNGHNSKGDESTAHLLDEAKIPAIDGAVDSVINEKGFWNLRAFRHALTCVFCIVTLANTWSRGALSMAMVCMVNATALDMSKLLSRGNGTRKIEEDYDDCGVQDLSLAADYGGHIVWTSSEQGILFSAIFWSGAFVGIPGGMLINRYGPKRVVVGCLCFTLLGSLLTPIAAMNGGLWSTFAVRFFMGIGGQVLVNTAIPVLMAHWIPPTERSMTLALYTSGNQIAVIFSMPINAALCRNKDFLGGWPAIFYVSGGIGIVAVILWQIFVDDTPAKSRWVSKNERNFIEKSLQFQSLRNEKDAMKNIPWKGLLLSHVLWACVATNFAAGLLAATLQSYIPTYYKQVLHLDLKSNGLFSSLPFLCQWASKIIFAAIADGLKRHTKISHTVISKIFNTLGSVVASAFLVACAFMNCHQVTWAIVFLSIANTAFSGIVIGAITTLLCIAPAYTGLVNGMARFAGQLSSIIAPYMVGAITADGRPEQWRIVFCIMGGLMTAVGIYYIICGTVKIQDWAKIQPSDAAVQNGSSTIAVINELADDKGKIDNPSSNGAIDTTPTDKVIANQKSENDQRVSTNNNLVSEKVVRF